MSEKLVDIVTWAVTQMQQDKIDKKQLKLLEQAGFSPKEISIAFSWLSDKMDIDKPAKLDIVMEPQQTFRIFNDAEKEFFTEEAYNNVIKLMAVGLIRPYHLEIIFDKAKSLGFYKISNDMVRQFIAFFIFDVPLPDENLVRFNFCGNESIN